MSGYPNQPNQHQMQQHQQQMMYQQQDPNMMMAGQQGNPGMPMNYGIGGMGQPGGEGFMQQQQHGQQMHPQQPQYSMTPSSVPPGMPPHMYSALSSGPSPMQARSPYNMGAHSLSSMGGGGPGSVPGSHGPGSVPQQGPASVQGPHSVPQHGPGSVSGPLSVPQPGSMTGPLSVPQPGSMMGPGSVPQPSSDSMGGPSCLSVPMGGVHSNQGPSPSSLSVPSHMGPSPSVDVQGGMGATSSPLPPSSLPPGASPSLSHGPLSHGGPGPQSNAPASVPTHGGGAAAAPAAGSSAATAAAAGGQAKEEQPYEGIFLTDPMHLSKHLISKDLRVSFAEMNKSMGELLKNRDNLTQEHNDKYTRDYNEFMAVCDQVEQALVMVMETSKMMSKLDRSYTPDGGGASGVRAAEYTTQPLMNYVDETNALTCNIEKAVGGVFDMMSKIRKRETLHKEQNKEVKMETD